MDRGFYCFKIIYSLMSIDFYFNNFSNAALVFGP